MTPLLTIIVIMHDIIVLENFYDADHHHHRRRRRCRRLQHHHHRYSNSGSEKCHSGILYNLLFAPLAVINTTPRDRE